MILRQIVSRIQVVKKTAELKKAIKGREGNIKIILGSAGLKEDGWISTDYPALDVTDERTFARFLGQGTVAAFLAEHVWEHLSSSDASLALSNCIKFLTAGGYLRLAVPDGNHPDPDYIEQVRPGGKGPGANDHKMLYNYKMLLELLGRAGFVANLLEWFDEKGDFHFEEWSPADGMVRRSMRFDQRNKDKPLVYTSLIIDGYKPVSA